MNSITLLNTGVATLGVVDLPENAQDFTLFHGNMNTFLLYRPGKAQGFLPRNKQKIELPPGNWIILGWSDEITEEQAKEIVESDRYYDGDPPGLGIVYYYRDYPEELEDSFLFTALESFKSWLLSNGITERKFLIKKAI